MAGRLLTVELFDALAVPGAVLYKSKEIIGMNIYYVNCGNIRAL